MNYHQTNWYQWVDYLWFFFIYAFLGWCLEVIYAAIKTQKFINRGFLNGPVCPIYGLGLLILLSLFSNWLIDFEILKRAELSFWQHTIIIGRSLFFLFVISTLFTSVLEFLTGWILEKFFHAVWWDYHSKKWNLKGYICLQFSLLWGIAAVVVLYLIHPFICQIMKKIHTQNCRFFAHFSLPEMAPLVEQFILALFILLFLIDGIITIIHLLKWQNRLKLLNSIEAKLHTTSNKMGEKLYGMTMKLIQIKDKETFMAEIQKIKARGEFEWAEWTLRYRELKENPPAGFLRIIAAFPSLKIHPFNRDEILKSPKASKTIIRRKKSKKSK